MTAKDIIQKQAKIKRESVKVASAINKYRDALEYLDDQPKTPNEVAVLGMAAIEEINRFSAFSGVSFRVMRANDAVTDNQDTVSATAGKGAKPAQK